MVFVLFLEDIYQVFAGGYVQKFEDATFVPSSLPCCFLLVVYEDIFPPEAMEKFFWEVYILFCAILANILAKGMPEAMLNFLEMLTNLLKMKKSCFFAFYNVNPG